MAHEKNLLKEDDSTKNPYGEIIKSLQVIRSFTNRKTYLSLRNACIIRIPTSELPNKLGNCKRQKKASTVDFIRAIKVISDFLLLNEYETQDALNSKGYHSATVVACMNLLLQANEYKLMEKFALMIDEDDNNKEARTIRKNLMTTRNNMIAPKTVKNDIERQKYSEHS